MRPVPASRAASTWLSCVALSLALPGCVSRPAPVASGAADPAAAAAADAIRPEAIRAHMAFLADDLLQGRAPGTPGYDLAARYARAHLEGIGLRGGAADGAWFQPVPLRRGQPVPGGSALMLRGAGGTRALRFETDYTFVDHQAGIEREISAPVVFAGFGVTAPERQYDDYAGLDVRGRIVAILSNAPSTFPGTLRAYHADSRTKQDNAAAHGAAGILGIRLPDDERRFPWDSVLRETRIGWSSLRWIDAAGRPAGLNEAIRAGALLNRSGSEALFAGEDHGLDAIFEAAARGAPPAFPLRNNATILRRSRHTPVASHNVVAILEGSDPVLRREHVVYTAHLDHIGVGPVVDGDAIYNGALDNAAGSAVVLEVARAFSRLPRPPRRSVVFLLVTAEEAGLVGSDHFAEHPTVPPESIVANINLDGGATFFPARDAIAWGEEHSDLKPLVRAAAAGAGLEISPDPFPEETIFIRSDQYSFVRRGVPSVFVDLGLTSADPAIDGGAVIRNWLVTDYHSPRDDMDQPFHFDSSARLARLAFLLGHAVAMQDARPRWNEGDFFGERFGRRAAGGAGPRGEPATAR
ncbi:MAG: M28 family peptidase [Candidatus Polarisedimenticolia bacterium]